MRKTCLQLYSLGLYKQWVSALFLHSSVSETEGLGTINGFVRSLAKLILVSYNHIFKNSVSVGAYFYPTSTGLIVSTTKEI